MSLFHAAANTSYPEHLSSSTLLLFRMFLLVSDSKAFTNNANHPQSTAAGQLCIHRICNHHHSLSYKSPLIPIAPFASHYQSASIKFPGVEVHRYYQCKIPVVRPDGFRGSTEYIVQPEHWPIGQLIVEQRQRAGEPYRTQRHGLVD